MRTAWWEVFNGYSAEEAPSWETFYTKRKKWILISCRTMTKYSNSKPVIMIMRLILKV